MQPHVNGDACGRVVSFQCLSSVARGHGLFSVWLLRNVGSLHVCAKLVPRCWLAVFSGCPTFLLCDICLGKKRASQFLRSLGFFCMSEVIGRNSDRTQKWVSRFPRIAVNGAREEACMNLHNAT